MTHDWLFWLIYTIIVLLFWRFFTIWDYKRIQKKRQMRFLNAIKLKYPEATVSFIAVESSAEAAIEKIKRQLDDHTEEKKKMEEWPWYS